MATDGNLGTPDDGSHRGPADDGRGSRMRVLLRSYWTDAGRRALANFLGLGLCTSIAQLSNLFVLFLLTQNLGPAGFGSVVFALTIQYYLYALGSAGQPAVVVRDLTILLDRADETITGFLVLTGVGSVVVGAMAALIGAFIPLTPSEWMLFCLLAAGNVAVAMNFAPLYDAQHRQVLWAALGLIGDFGTVAAVLAAVWLAKLTLPTVGAILAAKWLLTFALQAGAYRRLAGGITWRWSRERAAAMLRSGLPMMIAGAVALVPFHVSVILARLLRGEGDTALFGLALQVAMVYLLGAVLLQRIVQPHISGPYGLDRSFVWKLALFTGGFLGALWFAGVAGTWLTLQYVLDRPYREALGPCIALLSAGVVHAVGAIIALYLVRLQRERAVREAYVTGSSLYLVVAIIWFARLPIEGAALLTLGAAVLVTGFLFARVWWAWPRAGFEASPATDD